MIFLKRQFREESICTFYRYFQISTHIAMSRNYKLNICAVFINKVFHFYRKSIIDWIVLDCVLNIPASSIICLWES